MTGGGGSGGSGGGGGGDAAAVIVIATVIATVIVVGIAVVIVTITVSAITRIRKLRRKVLDIAHHVDIVLAQRHMVNFPAAMRFQYKGSKHIAYKLLPFQSILPPSRLWHDTQRAIPKYPQPVTGQPAT